MVCTLSAATTIRSDVTSQSIVLSQNPERKSKHRNNHNPTLIGRPNNRKQNPKQKANTATTTQTHDTASTDNTPRHKQDRQAQSASQHPTQHTQQASQTQHNSEATQTHRQNTQEKQYGNA
jgi:hypothetical protein